MSTIDSIQLGSLTLVAKRDHLGLFVHITLPSNSATDRFIVTVSQWNSLLALADTKLAGEREVERLRAEISALREALGEACDLVLRWGSGNAAMCDARVRELRKVGER